MPVVCIGFCVAAYIVWLNWYVFFFQPYSNIYAIMLSFGGFVPVLYHIKQSVGKQMERKFAYMCLLIGKWSANEQFQSSLSLAFDFQIQTKIGNPIKIESNI